MTRIGSIIGTVLVAVTAVTCGPPPDTTPEVIVFGGPEEAGAWLQSENWWGETKRGEQLSVPYALITGISPRWCATAESLPVSDKKEVFYRFLLPLVLHANVMVQDRRERLLRGDKTLAAGKPLSEEELEGLRRAAVLLRITDETAAGELSNSSPERLREVIAEALYRLDVIPPGLVLGQAAYESGYGTSRFATEGNALFGQWTFGGEGLVPEQQRKHLGDHRIASFEWPFDSVRGYYLNLSSHPAYEDFRKLRAKLRSEGKPLTSLALADGLKSYSERGQAYVDTLKGVIETNKLDIADDAKFRDEPMRLLVSVESPEAAAKMRAEIDAMRASGELAEIIARMRLE
jgi:Bax protein